MLQQYRYSNFDWKPSPVVALATSVDDSQVAAAREDGSLEIWLVSPGSVGWHCQLVIHGDPNLRVSSLVWCRSGSKEGSSARLFSSRIDGSISEWDLYHLKQKIVVDSVGVSIWQMALQPQHNALVGVEHDSHNMGNGAVIDRYSDSDDKSESDDDDGSVDLHEQSLLENPCIAAACDDGCIRMYSISDADGLTYHKSMPRVSGRVLSVTWSPDGKLIYSGSSDGIIRCWDAKRAHELYRITVGLGGLGSAAELCVWSLLALSCGTLVSADSTGSVQFWDIQHGTLLQAHTLHKGDANALAAIPSHRRVFSAGSDGQVILYKLSSTSAGSSSDGKPLTEVIKKWMYVGHVRVHTHDVKALTVAVPIIREETLPDEKLERKHRKAAKPVDFSYRKWASSGVPMLLSAGDDTKIFAYSAMEFMNFSPHDICPAPQRVPAQLILNSVLNLPPLLLVQASYKIDIFALSLRDVMFEKGSGPSARLAPNNPLAQVTSKQKIICSTLSPSGLLLSFSSHVKLSLVQLQRSQGSKGLGPIIKRKLPSKLPPAHSMVFTSDSSRLIISGQDMLIYVVDVGILEITHVFTPCRKQQYEDLPPQEPPITKMFTSSDGQWLAAINCFGDIYVFNLETQREHWFISRLDGASVTAGGFSPRNSNVLVVTTSSNQVYAFDVEAKQLGEWSKRNSLFLPKRFLDFPGEVIGLSFPLSLNSSSVVVYSSRAMCLIDFKKPIDQDASDSAPMELLNSTGSIKANGKVNSKRKREKDNDMLQIKDCSRANFEFFSFSDPVHFVGHLSKSSVLVVHKPWLVAVKKLDAAPVHRHVYGT